MEVDRHFQNATFSIHLVFPETVMWNDLGTLLAVKHAYGRTGTEESCGVCEYVTTAFVFH